jgi:hypothetical protein
MGWLFVAYDTVGAATDGEIVAGLAWPCVVEGASHASVSAALASLRHKAAPDLGPLLECLAAVGPGQCVVLRGAACLCAFQALGRLDLAALAPVAVWLGAQLRVLFRHAFIGGAVLLARYEPEPSQGRGLVARMFASERPREAAAARALASLAAAGCPRAC